MLSDYFDAANRSSILDHLSPTTDEPLPSMFRRDLNGVDAFPHPRQRSSNAKSLLIVVGTFLTLIAAAGVLVLRSASDKEAFSLDNEAVERSAAPVSLQPVVTEASISSPTPAAFELPHAELAAPTQPATAEGEPWSGTMEAYKRLLAQRDASNASSSKRTADDRTLGQFETWMKAKPQ
jgi:hypothetical protein